MWVNELVLRQLDLLVATGNRYTSRANKAVRVGT
jgi:hypothetical protein